MTCYEDQDILVELDIADLWEQGLWPLRPCKFCERELYNDRLPTSTVRIFGYERVLSRSGALSLSKGWPGATAWACVSPAA